jgi:hypothetical protein
MSKFPKPYVNNVKKDSIMQYVPMEKTDIGSRSSGMPKDAKSQGMGLDHVGGTASGSK